MLTINVLLLIVHHMLFAEKTEYRSLGKGRVVAYFGAFFLDSYRLLLIECSCVLIEYSLLKSLLPTRVSSSSSRV
jgi:hypothetical protein